MDKSPSEGVSSKLGISVFIVFLVYILQIKAAVPLTKSSLDDDPEVLDQRTITTNSVHPSNTLK